MSPKSSTVLICIAHLHYAFLPKTHMLREIEDRPGSSIACMLGLIKATATYYVTCYEKRDCLGKLDCSMKHTHDNVQLTFYKCTMSCSCEYTCISV